MGNPYTPSGYDPNSAGGGGAPLGPPAQPPPPLQSLVTRGLSSVAGRLVTRGLAGYAPAFLPTLLQSTLRPDDVDFGGLDARYTTVTFL